MIYLDNAATTKPNLTALKQAETFLSERYFNPSALYKEGFALQTEIKKARAEIVSFIADPTQFDLVFTSGGTEADNTAIFGYGKRGNIVITAGEHSAILSSANALKNRGIEVRIAPLKEDGCVDETALLSLVDEKTSLVSVMHVNNETGAINDILKIAEAVKKKNSRAVFHSDGVQAFGKIPVRLGKQIDLYSVSAHKIGGVKGVGAIVYRKQLPFQPFVFGGGQESGRRSGTENVFGIMDFYYATKERFGVWREAYQRVSAYKTMLANGLDKEIYSVFSLDGSPYILSVSAVGLRGEVLMHMLNDQGLIVGTGSACSSNEKARYSRVILACGKDEKTADGVLRISFSPENTEEEIVSAIRILNETGKALKEKMA